MDEYLKGLNLTSQEMNKVLYHRQNLNNPYRDADGNIVTIYSTGIQIPSGKFKGQFASVPGFVNGKIIEDEEELYKIWKNDIDSGKWPIYPTSKKLNQRDQFLHQVMDRDVNLMKSKQVTPTPINYTDPFGSTNESVD